MNNSNFESKLLALFCLWENVLPSRSGVEIKGFGEIYSANNDTRSQSTVPLQLKYSKHTVEIVMFVYRKQY